MDSPFANRLRKNFRHLRRWAQRQDLGAFRIYDRDLPECPYVVEWYEGRVHLVEFPRRGSFAGARDEEVLAAVAGELGVEPAAIYRKVHQPKAWGEEQYGREAHSGEFFTAREQGLSFWVNLRDYLDTGLFLDHRNTRARIRDEAGGKRMLNLFCYTGSFTVYAAAGGAVATTSVDLSARYLDWAERNLKLNDLAGPNHQRVRADAAAWLKTESGRGPSYDLIVMDPPSFSSSKQARTFDIQRDHPRLLTDALSLLASDGALYFSTNYRGFSPRFDRLDATFTELTPRSIPEDFHQRDIHRCWRIRHGSRAHEKA